MVGATLLVVAVAVVAAVATAVVGGSAVQITRASNRAEGSAEQLCRVLDRDRDLVDRLIASGGDRSRLEAAYHAYVDQRLGSGRREAGLRLAEAIEDQAASLDGDQTSARLEVIHRVRQVRAARHRYDEAVSSWAHATTGWSGRSALWLGLAAPPGDWEGR